MGETFEIKDSNGNAGASPITVSGNGHNIDGSSTYSISSNYGSLTARYNGTQWSKVFSV